MDPMTIMGLARAAQGIVGPAVMAAGTMASGIAGGLIPDKLHQKSSNVASTNLLSPNTRSINTTEWYTPGKLEKGIKMGIMGASSFLAGGAEMGANYLSENPIGQNIELRQPEPLKVPMKFDIRSSNPDRMALQYNGIYNE